MTIAGRDIHRFTRAEYYEMASRGFFEGKRVELLAGEVLDMSPQNEAHAVALALVNRFLCRHLPDALHVRSQSPLSVIEDSDPEPDIAVVPAEQTGGESHPATALLAVEIADTSLSRDRRKRAFYAAAKIPEYWILNLRVRQVEVYGNPVEDSRSETGWDYLSTRTLDENEVLACGSLALPRKIVKELLPPK